MSALGDTLLLKKDEPERVGSAAAGAGAAAVGFIFLVFWRGILFQISFRETRS